MSDIFHEVEEDLRRERLGQLWARYGIIVIILAIAIVLGTAATVYWKQYRQRANEAQADALAAASQTIAGGNDTLAMQQFGQIAAPGGVGYPVLALFRQAGILGIRGDTQGALAIYDKIAQSNADDRLKALARLRAAGAVEDTESPDALKTRIADLAKDDSPWRYEARDILAYADLRAGKVDDATKAYSALAEDAAAPDSLRNRAKQIVSYLNGGAVSLSSATQLPPAPPPGPDVAAPDTSPGAAAAPPPVPSSAEPKAAPKSPPKTPTASPAPGTGTHPKPPASKPKPH